MRPEEFDRAGQIVVRAYRELPGHIVEPDYEQELGAVRLRDMLLMNGTDHQMPQPWLGRVVAEANEMQDDYEFVVTSLGRSAKLSSSISKAWR